MHISDFSVEKLEYLIELFSKSHEDLKRELLSFDEVTFDEYFFKDGYEQKDIIFERNQFFSDAKVTYHEYYCYVFAKIFKELFPELNYYERYDGAHVAIGNDNFIFDICGIYQVLDNGEVYDSEGFLYWSSEDDEWFLDELNYFGRLNSVLEARLREIFFQNISTYIQSNGCKL